jgi:RecB family exonuclease
MAELLEILDDVWNPEGFGTPEEEIPYREHARQVLRQYHLDNAADYRIPAATEHRFRVEIEGVTISGIIDRMDRLPGGGYEIIDYKTNRRLPPKRVVEADLQLSIYHLAAREIWGIEPERLTLYYLLPGQRMTSTRGPEQLDDVRRRIASVAERIEAGRFEARENRLCDWCDFKPRCPVFRHRYEEAGPPRIGEAVDEWVRLKREDRERWRRLEELGAIIRAYGEEHGLQRLYGTEGAIALVRRVEQTMDPATVRRVLEPLGRYEDVLAVDPQALHELIEKRVLPPDAEDELLASREAVRVSTALYLRDLDRSRR